jgi:hypothetical protein
VFIKKLASRFLTREAPARAHMAAFGKHPGWNDHIDDLGLETELLVTVKRLLYVEGIGGNIDSGAWEHLPEDQRLPAFDHLFILKAGGDLVIGRLWSSSDGKGRTKYPMVVCADCSGQDPLRAFDAVLPLLDRLHTDCQRTTSADAVRAAVERAQAGLEAALPDGQAEAAQADGTLASLAARPEMGDSSLGLLRILYQIEREMTSYRRGGAKGSRSVILQPHHLRVPACADSPRARAALWLSFLAGQLDPAAPLVLILPLAEDWVDLLVGAPGPAQLVCIRANAKAVPLATDIPYTLDDDFLGRARQAIAS